MYNPVNYLLSTSASKEELREVLSIANDGIGAIADTLRCADLTTMDDEIMNQFGSALLILKGVIENAFIKMEESTNE
ncbi:hypothetical protein GYW75_02065 [Gilliamella sp. ESL0232]|uniref:hypothetical protein n=1 Tax=Gilliamella sp. ESL0232 TaxID=2705037 RepID=UPI001580B6AE|nr:hypothetical protein [Gilliamella sp. ESL0232]NUE95177.1 hypothetical protein [Gilliamella sp. ESL0232]